MTYTTPNWNKPEDLRLVVTDEKSALKKLKGPDDEGDYIVNYGASYLYFKPDGAPYDSDAPLRIVNKSDLEPQVPPELVARMVAAIRLHLSIEGNAEPEFRAILSELEPVDPLNSLAEIIREIWREEEPVHNAKWLAEQIHKRLPDKGMELAKGEGA